MIFYLVISIACLVLWIFIEWYVYKGLFEFLNKQKSARMQLVGKRIYQIVNTIFVLCFLGIFAAGLFRDADSYPWIGYLIGIMMMISLPKLVYALFLFVEDLFSIPGRLVQNNSRSGFQPGRRKFVSQMGLITAALPFASVVHGILRGRYAYTVHEVELRYPDLPEAFDGFRMVQLSDIHAGSFDQVEPVLKGLKMVQDLQADLILFTGDMVNDFAEEIESWVPHFQALKAPFGKFSTLGNHDYGRSVRWENDEKKEANLTRLKQFQGEMGFQLLMNERVSLTKDGEHINLIGVENWGKPPFPQKGDLNKALMHIGEGEFNVLLSHDPSHWEAEILPHPTKIHLTLSGHTHGAQMGVESPGWRWSPVQYMYPQWAGLYEKQSQRIYVNRGFGFVAIPARMGIWPEITHITLRKGKA